LRLGRKFIGFKIEAETATRARARVAVETADMPRTS
jgi:hypothetical protein